MKIKLIDFGGKAPVRAHYNDAGADVFAPKTLMLEPGEGAVIPLGFGLEIPDGYAGFIFPRSSMAANRISCLLPPIDSGYTGEIHAFLYNASPYAFPVVAGDKIGQLVILPCLIPDFVKGDLGEERNQNAFGSTGR